MYLKNGPGLLFLQTDPVICCLTPSWLKGKRDHHVKLITRATNHRETLVYSSLNWIEAPWRDFLDTSNRLDKMGPDHPDITRDLTRKWGKTVNKNMVSRMFYYELFRVHHGKAFWTPPLKTLWAPSGGFDCTRRVLPPSDWTVIFFIYKWWIWSRCKDPTSRETRQDVHVAVGELERINATQLYEGAAPPWKCNLLSYLRVEKLRSYFCLFCCY